MNTYRDEHWAQMGEIVVRQFIQEMSPGVMRSEAMDWLKRHEATKQERAEAEKAAALKREEARDRATRFANINATVGTSIALVALAVAIWVAAK